MRIPLKEGVVIISEIETSAPALENEVNKMGCVELKSQYDWVKNSLPDSVLGRIGMFFIHPSTEDFSKL